MERDVYSQIRSGGAGFYEQKRGLIAVWGKEAVQFLDGMITNNVKKLEDGAEMLAAFPNAQGRLIAVVRVLRQGDRVLFDTEEATREKVFQDLFRFTFAGDFFAEDLSDQYRYFELFNTEAHPADGFAFKTGRTNARFVPLDGAVAFRAELLDRNAVEVNDDVYETLRIEKGVPKYGVDMDETTIVPELGLEGMISYNKGCYIGQEIIARIHFRGHVAKQLTGLQSETDTLVVGTELSTADGKSAGRITSAAYSPKYGKNIALAFVRYDYLAEGTELIAGNSKVTAKSLPFIA